MTLDAEPVAEADLSAFVLTLLDDHLAAMRGIRERLRPAGAITLGARRTIALDSVAIAERYADRMTRALNAPQPKPGDPAAEIAEEPVRIIHDGLEASREQPSFTAGRVIRK